MVRRDAPSAERLQSIRTLSIGNFLHPSAPPCRSRAWSSIANPATYVPAAAADVVEWAITTCDVFGNSVDSEEGARRDDTAGAGDNVRVRSREKVSRLGVSTAPAAHAGSRLPSGRLRESGSRPHRAR